MKSVAILPAAAKALRKHKAEVARILERIETYADNPSSLANNVKALSGSTGVRLRVGDFRVVFEETDGEIIVTRIGPRGGIYD